jgi:trk system potassium uptake protein TrkA
MPGSLYIVIAGCGRLGSHLANRLSRQGHGLVVIDQDEAAFKGLSSEFSGFRVEGDVCELRALRQARMDKADIVFAVTRKDNANLMVVHAARTLFKVPRVMARVYHPSREGLFRLLGADTVCPTTEAAEKALDWVGPFMVFPGRSAL